MNELITKTIKNTDWFFEYIDGDLQKWQKGRESYLAAISILKVLDQDQLNYYMQFIPVEIQPKVLKDLGV